jgi:hypothetical protein
MLSFYHSHRGLLGAENQLKKEQTMDYTGYIEEAKKAASPEELRELAASAGIELTDEKAKEYFDRLQGAGEPIGDEIAEEELANVAGGIYNRAGPSCH